MNTNTGEIKTFSQQEIDDGTAAALGYTVQVMRDLTAREIADQRIRMYSPCGCGSGTKFKFCCWKKGGTHP